MAYTTWSVVFGEQPTAAKWNQLGANDAGFKDGTNIDNDAILQRHIAAMNVTADKLNNLYSYAAASAAGSFSASVYKAHIYELEKVDRNNNYNPVNGEYTAPADGLYFFYSSIYMINTADIVLTHTVNSTSPQPTDPTSLSFPQSQRLAQVISIVELSAGDIVRTYIRSSIANTASVDERGNKFIGFMITPM